ncbi:GMC family oxidoreductase N-terminal domain-containing protein, partial [bacterium]|nr:GMC family oxidoreductase N-terminal domain-containing protein [bacterium]
MLDKLLSLLGYPPAPPFWRDLTRFHHAVCRAVADTLYPAGSDRWPSYTEGRVLELLHDYLASLSRRKRSQITLLLAGFEWTAVLTPPFRRFSFRNPARRGRHLTAWETSRWYWLRIGFSSLRMLFNLPYLAAPAVRARIGETTRSDCQGADHPAADLSAGVFEYPQLRQADRREEVDFAVVGSGPGGAVIARELAVAGRSVAVLEEGPFFRPETYRGNALELMRDLFSERGLRAAFGNVTIPTMQAKALGGNSVVNSAICWRAPGWLFENWQSEFGIEGLSLEELGPSYDRAERLASVVPTRDAVLGRKGELFHRGCAAAGAVGRPTNRATKDCQGCSECMFGCRRGAKQNMERCYIPDAVQHGARFYTACRAEDLLIERGRVAGVRGYVLEPGTGQRVGQVTVRAKATILAAGVMASPLILLKNRLPWHSPAIGRNLSLHPGLAATAVFADDVLPWTGATQGADSATYLDEKLHMEVL